MGIEPRALINLWFQVQHSPFWANWEFACKNETLGSLYSHALLILTYTSESRNQVVHEQKLKDPLSSTCQIRVQDKKNPIDVTSFRTYEQMMNASPIDTNVNYNSQKFKYYWFLWLNRWKGKKRINILYMNRASPFHLD